MINTAFLSPKNLLLIVAVSYIACLVSDLFYDKLIVTKKEGE